MTPTELADKLSEPLPQQTRLNGELLDQYRVVVSAAERDLIVAALRASTDRALPLPSKDQIRKAICCPTGCAREGDCFSSKARFVPPAVVEALFALSPKGSSEPVAGEIAAKDAEIRALNLRILALANAIALDHERDVPTLNRLVTILKNKFLTDGGASSDPETNRYIRGRCSAFRETADMLQSMIDADGGEPTLTGPPDASSDCDPPDRCRDCDSEGECAPGCPSRL